MDLAEKCDFGILAIEQEKAFDRDDHGYLMDTLKAFGFRKGLISWVTLLYNGKWQMAGIYLAPLSKALYK